MIIRTLLAVILLGTAIARADTTSERLLKQDIDRQEQERRDRRWDEPRTSTPLPAPELERASGQPASDTCFSIREIHVTQAQILPAKPLARLIAAYEGRCLSSSDLQALQQGMNSLALSRGLVTTRVVIPEQNLSSGILQLEVWPGHMEAATLNSPYRMELEAALPLSNGDVLNLRALEQAIDNLNRLESLQASVELRPGEKPGGSIAAFTVNRLQPWHLAAVWDSEAMEQHPVNTARASLTLDSPLKLADRLIVGANATVRGTEVDNAYGGSIDYDAPIGWWRIAVGADQFEYRNPITSGLTTFVSSGKSQSIRAEVSRVVWRDNKHRLNIALLGKQRINNNYIDSIAIGVSTSRLKAMGLRADISRVAAPWVMDASLSAEQGEARTLAMPSPVDADYSRVIANTRLQYHWKKSSLSWSVSGQWSDSILLPSEQYALAGNIKGFSPLSLNAATGMASRVEWARPFFFDWKEFKTIRLQIGAELGWAPAASGNISEEQLTAVTMGVIAPWKKMVIQLQVAAPLEFNSTQNAISDCQMDANVSIRW
ncbi:MAG: ShlB/FhaC/HecB family hemolysin secretion/activation protein [Moraxellaceae bacterium]|jgi:hemolysin activation/secretion protein|nr:ShlB/FhaC/HecB family hemolysin secretion/activation protein [Moraxellaceae bacterium]MBP9730165.1 ShlB/FhaC/HecB family hemolysin secretion/activation protein [Moraxellaceae bacterium]